MLSHHVEVARLLHEEHVERLTAAAQRPFAPTLRRRRRTLRPAAPARVTLDVSRRRLPSQT
jgi:hypothetical protein